MLNSGGAELTVGSILNNLPTRLASIFRAMAGGFWVGESETVSLPNVTSEADSQIARTLLCVREMILKGEFAPGERLSEAPLASRVGVSRTPIRLALERLA